MGGGGWGRSRKKYSCKGKLNLKNSCMPINPKKYSCYGLKKIHTRNLITKKNSCRSKIPPPPKKNFSNGPSLKGVIWDNTYWLDNLSLVITKGYGIQATRIEFQNTFAPALCFAWVSCDKWSEHTWSDYEWQKVQMQVIKLHFVHWPHSFSVEVQTNSGYKHAMHV